jgi:LmbE family N-acetylglucosaminyl deacetylase
MINKKVLIIAAHPDDEILGCGGTIAKLIKNNCKVGVLFLSEGVSARSKLGETRKWDEEILARESMAMAAAKYLGFSIIGFMRNPNLRMDTLSLLDITKSVQNILIDNKPNIIFTHHSGDLNTDHQICFNAVITACRPSGIDFIESIFSFEVPSSTEWSSSVNLPSFRPNYFVDIDSEIESKLSALTFYDFEMREFPHPRSKENIKALSQIRGSEIGFKFAEAFMLIRGGLKN